MSAGNHGDVSPLMHHSRSDKQWQQADVMAELERVKTHISAHEHHESLALSPFKHESPENKAPVDRITF